MKELPWNESVKIFVHQLEIGDRFTLSSSDCETIFTVDAIGWGIEGKEGNLVEIYCPMDEQPVSLILDGVLGKVYLLAPLPDLVYPNQLMSGDKFSIYPSDGPIKVESVMDGYKLDRKLSPAEWTFVFVDGTQFYSMRNDRRVYRHKVMREIK